MSTLQRTLSGRSIFINKNKKYSWDVDVIDGENLFSNRSSLNKIMISNIKAINPFKNDNQFESDEGKNIYQFSFCKIEKYNFKRTCLLNIITAFDIIKI